MEGDVFMFKKQRLGISSLAITAFVGLGMATEALAGPAKTTYFTKRRTSRV